MPKLLSKKLKRISLDTETTGLDLYHIAKPFLVTITDELGPVYWEWDVNPLTRQPIIPKSDLVEIVDRINEADEIVFQNAKFDIQVLKVAGIKWLKAWYKKVHDTLFSGHLIASSEPLSLDVLSIRYLRVDIRPLEEKLKEACNEARKIARRDFPKWMIAKEGLPGMPSVSGGTAKNNEESPWKNDAWLPRAIAKELKYPKEHPWWTITANYANGDSQATRAVFEVQEDIIKERGLQNVYEERRRLIPVIVSMESRGVTYSNKRLQELNAEFVEESTRLENTCRNLTGGKLDKLPKSGTSKLMLEVMYDDWKMPIIKRSEKTGKPSVDKKVLEAYEVILPKGSKPLAFVKALRTKRKRDTAISYMGSYVSFGLPTGHPEIYVLHSSLNATGQVTLRWSSSNPNEQNISKEGYEGAKSVRYCFGPAPDREWWSLDYKNIELRIPAYEANEVDMIQLFERPNDPPFFGSNHLMAFSILHPKEWEEYGAKVKDVFADTLYQWTKNGNFAVQYGAMEESGTADAAYHVEGGQRMIKERFKNIALLNEDMIALAKSQGYVETMYDHDIGGSYPIQTPKSVGKYGNLYVKPTIPLNYHIQSTAMWCMGKAMVRVHNYLQEWNEERGLDDTNGAFITMQVHDELVIDLPRGEKPDSNLSTILKVAELMNQSGEDIGVPLGVDYNYHPDNWAEKVKVKSVA